MLFRCLCASIFCVFYFGDAEEDDDLGCDAFGTKSVFWKLEEKATAHFTQMHCIAFTFKLHFII